MSPPAAIRVTSDGRRFLPLKLRSAMLPPAMILAALGKARLSGAMSPLPATSEMGTRSFWCSGSWGRGTPFTPVKVGPDTGASTVGT